MYHTLQMNVFKSDIQDKEMGTGNYLSGGEFSGEWGVQNLSCRERRLLAIKIYFLVIPAENFEFHTKFRDSGCLGNITMATMPGP